MQAETIIGLMQEELPFTRETLPELSEVLEEYPYFQAGHLLYTLNLHANKDTRLAAETRKTSGYLSDRRNFFYRMKKDFLALQLQELEEKNAKQPQSFDRIDYFLSEREKEPAGKDLSLPLQSFAATGDYTSYLLSHETSETPVAAVQLKNQDIIDQFISADEQSKIKIVLPKKTGKEPEEDLEELEIPHWDKVEESSFFSETLAKIYLKQKKYDKALEIIRKLNLIYPEKSIYFADQIRFLEKWINHSHKTK